MQLDRIADIDVFMIATAPMKGIALCALDPINVDLSLGEQVEVVLRKIFTDNADDADRSEKTCAQSEVRRRSAEDALGRAEWRFNRIKGDGTDNQYAHKYFPIIGRNATPSFFGIRARSVMIASFNAEAQAHERADDNCVTARRIVRRARSTFCLSTVSTCSISTSPT